MTTLESIANELHRPARKIFPRRSVITRFIDDLWQADLMDMQSHSRQNYVVIDTYSKYVWVEALKNKTSKECTNGTWNWYNTISKIMYNYNNTKHRTIKCTPNEARMDTNKIKFNTQFNDTLYKPKLKVNDKVRISKYKHIFSKGYTPNWTTEIFTVSKVLQTNPEIKLTDFPDTFLVERIIKKVGNKMFVKWLGFDSSQNSWITSSDILK
ncbi:hypothetical protein AGLY_017391 [Aphis glycines]|uniref:Chromo domain-containing protein n=1 Tax=Aphis glycines TaxID=307491 RepID=A0A6G0SV65_APHGL|nr:hypothetical protein AGLY_017391 [Aphis glycines]